MILYLDASALVKRYVREFGSSVVSEAIDRAAMVGTAIISRAETAAALAKAVRLGVLQQPDAFASLQSFRKDWLDLVRIQLAENLISQADALAWDHALRGYDAVHLAAAVLWQETMGESVTMATFDQQLWKAAEQVRLIPFPSNLPELLREWKRESGKSAKRSE